MGETLTESTQVLRVKVVTTFLHAGISLNDIFRELLEENGYQLTDKRNMFDLIPLSKSEKMDAISKGLKERMSLFVSMAPLVQVKQWP